MLFILRSHTPQCKSYCRVILPSVNHIAESYSAVWIILRSHTLRCESYCGVILCYVNQIAESYSIVWIISRSPYTSCTVFASLNVIGMYDHITIIIFTKSEAAVGDKNFLKKEWKINIGQYTKLIFILTFFFSLSLLYAAATGKFQVGKKRKRKKGIEKSDQLWCLLCC